MVSNTIIAMYAKNVIHYISSKKIKESVEKLTRELDSDALELNDIAFYSDNDLESPKITRDRGLIDKIIKIVKYEANRLKGYKIPVIGDMRKLLLNLVETSQDNQIKICLSTAEDLLYDPKYLDPNSEATQEFKERRKGHFIRADISKFICDPKHPKYMDIQTITQEDVFKHRCSAYKNLMEVFPKVVEALPEVDFRKIFDSNGNPVSKECEKLIEETIYPMMVQWGYRQKDKALEAYLAEFKGQRKIVEIINADMENYMKMINDDNKNPEKEIWVLVGEPPRIFNFQYKISPQNLRIVYWFLLNKIVGFGEGEINNNIDEAYSKPLTPTLITT